MNSLLKRQIRKYLPDHLTNNNALKPLFEAIDRSYTNFDEQFSMLQRAMQLSSKELFEANKRLTEKANAQKEILNKLNNVVKTLEFYELPDASTKQDNIDTVKLVDFITNQTKDIIKINKQRDALLNDLENQNEELSDYAHMVSHDLKSPLQNIEALITWIKEEYYTSFDSITKNHITLISSNIEKMDALINGILEYSTIGKTNETPYDINCNLLIDDIINTIQIPKSISINITNNLPTIKGDVNRLKQLFQNLITNAIKYNDKPKGFIKISSEEKNGFWQFSIEDNGIGIDKKYFDKIFKTFYKLENRLDSTGIGLSIVKKIVTLYNGQIWLESIPNKGTTFYFTLKK